MPKILLVSENFPPKVFRRSGLKAYELAKRLAKYKLNVSVISSIYPKAEGFEIKEGFKIYRLIEAGRKKFPKSERKMLEDFRGKFNLIHPLDNPSISGCITETNAVASLDNYSLFCPKGNLFFKEKKPCTGCSFIKFIECILTSNYMHGEKIKITQKFNPVFWALSYMRFLRSMSSLKKFRKFIVVDDSFKELLIKEGVKSRQIRKIPPLFALDNVVSGNEYPLEKSTVNIVYIGSLDSLSGVDLLIDAFNQIDEGNLRLIIVGSGPDRKKLESISDSHVRFLGDLGLDVLPSIYRQADVIVVPPRWPEPLSDVLVEACFYGKPIIATKFPGNRDGVVDGVNGFLVTPDASAIKSKLIYLLKNPDERRGLGKGSKSVFEDRFSRKKIVEKTADFYGI